ncbi:hypothetical protein [Curtobacterium sp. MCSS17_011]|uniref:hypothetical protein n=1 Tax=Curtobacterium sp. MCSS17_011 TaxID=2175643 RepID=UPI0011B735A2|nr:hypothetical protein [Curtobacterium sp. MCSS17_011]
MTQSAGADIGRTVVVSPATGMDHRTAAALAAAIVDWRFAGISEPAPATPGALKVGVEGSPANADVSVMRGPTCVRSVSIGEVAFAAVTPTLAAMVNIVRPAAPRVVVRRGCLVMLVSLSFLTWVDPGGSTAPAY